MREFAVLNATPHPQFNAQTRLNDVGVIRLSVDVIPTADIRPVALPTWIAANPYVLPLENEEGSFAGFGFQNNQGTGPTNNLYRGFQRVIGPTRCLLFFNHNPSDVFCGEDILERSSACHGDVGAPFVVSYRRQDVIVGLVTMHPPCGQASPTAFTRITQYRLWIDQQLAI